MNLRRGEIGKLSGRARRLTCLISGLVGLAGCGHAFPIAAAFQGDAKIAADARLNGDLELKLATAADPGEMVATVVRPGQSASCARIALVDVDGVLLNQNYGSLYAVGDNPLAGLRDKLETAARDPRVMAVVLRINSPGGSVTACDVMAEELRQFRARHTSRSSPA